MAYFRPQGLDDALGFLAEGPATVAAGCTDLFPATERRALSGRVLDITALDALRGIDASAAQVCIGAGVTWSQVIAADLPPAFDMLKQAAVEVGSVQIQNAGTVAGNICNASPAADGMPCLLALDAEVELRSASGTRVLPLGEFVTGPRQTARRADELVTAILIPGEAARGVSRFVKLGARRYLVISIAMVAVRLVCDAGRVTDAAVSVGSCSPVAVRLTALEAVLAGQPADGALAGRVSRKLVAPALAPIADIRADAAYRGDAAVELLRRALRDLVALGEGLAA